jgi:hypothetical protein
MMGESYSTSVATEKPILFNAKHERIDADELIDTCKKDPKRILADDEIGTVVYVGDLRICRLSGLADLETGELQNSDGHWQKVVEISRVRFPARIIRRQIGSVVMSITSDSVFLVRDGEYIRKVRGEDLTKGMVLATGEKVFW